MIGTTLGPYRLDRELGTGGMGTVYAATVTGWAPGLPQGSRVAIKVVHPHLLDAKGLTERFLREAQIGKSVVHENVVSTYDADEVFVGGARRRFLVMEYVEGQTLRSLLAELERVPEELCRHVGREVAKGLAAIHAAGVVHRDVKPENVLITAGHAVKVMDLGIARLDDEVLRLSQTGVFVGSIHYAAPECFLDGGGRIDARTDLHALGVLLYELAGGVNPYQAGSVAEVLQRILHEEPRRLGDVNPQVSAFFEEVVHVLLAKAPEDRFSDAGRVASVLEEGEASSWWASRAKAMREASMRPLRRVRIPRETAVYGREEEIARLVGLVAKARAGEGQVVVLSGEAGIGKSRLVDETIGRLSREGEDLQFLFGHYPPGGAGTATGALASAFREHLGSEGLREALRERLGPASVLSPAFAALLLGTAPPPGAEPLTKDSIQTCFVHVARSLAAERTTVILVDDLHYAGEEALSLFLSLALAVPGHRLCLIGTTRPGIDEKWLAALTRWPMTTAMTLGRLGPKDLALLLKDSFRSEDLAARLGHQIAVKSDGNPFFAFEIIRGLREGQFIAQKDDGTWVSTRVIDDIRIPSSVLDLVNARVADLSQPERDLLDVAACLGFEFDPALVADALDTPLLPTLKAFGQIERRHRLVRAAGRRYAFDHHQVQEALYGSVFEQVRESYHAALAQALERRTGAAGKDPSSLDGALCVDLCEHFLNGARGDRALRYLAAAQSHLFRGHVHARAVALAERALAVEGLLSGAERAKVLLRLAGALDALGRRGREEECAREAERLAEQAGDDDLRGQAASALGLLAWRTARPAEAEAAWRRALALARARGDRRAEAAAATGLGNVYYGQWRLAEAREHHEPVLAIYREIGDRRGEAIATGNVGNLHYAEGRYAAARERYEQVLSISREIGFRRGEAIATGNLAGILASEGRFAEAAEHEEREVAICREIGDRQVEASALGNLGSVLLRLGDRERAKQVVEEALSICREVDAKHGEAHELATLSAWADEEGDLSLALRHARESLALRRAIGQWDAAADTFLLLGDLLRRAGSPEESRRALDEALALFRQQGRRGQAARALALLACLPGGSPGEALEALRQAGEDGDGADLRLVLWQATRDRSHLVAARRLLDESLARVPEPRREAMRANLRVHREILSACREQGI